MGSSWGILGDDEGIFLQLQLILLLLESGAIFPRYRELVSIYAP